MTPSVELFELIKSLTKTEKRYIRLNFTIHKGDKNYLKLFDAIEKQGEYNEAKIKEAFRNEHFINRLPVAKAYLYSTLLKVLRQYHSSDSAEVKINEMLHEVDILIGKGLFTQAHKILFRAKKIANEYDKTLKHIEILRRESRLMSLVLYISKKRTSPADIIYEEDNNIQKLKKGFELKRLSWKISDTVFKTGLSDKKQLLDLLSNTDISLLNQKPLNADFDTYVYYYHTAGNYARVLGDNKGFYENMRDLIHLYETNPKQIEEVPYNFLAVLNNFIHAVNLNKKYEEALEYLKKIKSIEFASRLKYLLVYETVLRIETTILVEQSNFSETVKIVSDNEKTIKELEADKIQLNLFRIFFNVSWAYFNLKKFDFSLRYINKILNDKSIKNNIDMRLQTELLNLLVHFEMNNFDLLESLIKSQRLLIKKKYKHNRFHLMVLDMFQKLIKNFTSSKKTLKAFLTDLNQTTDSEILNSLAQCSFYIQWLEKRSS